MQVLKEEIKELILHIAEKEFLGQGYEKISMKEIAKQVGVSTGNLYRYFANKEALFDAVTMPAYHSLQYLIESHEQESDTSVALGMEMIGQLAEVLSDLLADHRAGFLILIYGSRGTRHELAKNNLCDLLSNHIETHLLASINSPTRDDMNLQKPAFDIGIARPIAVAFLEGFFEIIRIYEDRDQIHAMIKQYIAVWFIGLQMLA